MQNTLREALQACATFNIQGDATYNKTLAFLPGIYSTMTENTFTRDGSSKTAVVYTDPSNLVNAGYTTLDKLRAASDAELGSTLGISDGRIAELRQAINFLAPVVEKAPDPADVDVLRSARDAGDGEAQEGLHQAGLHDEEGRV